MDADDIVMHGGGSHLGSHFHYFGMLSDASQEEIRQGLLSMVSNISMMKRNRLHLRAYFWFLG